MKISFENLGAIKKIEIDLSKKISIFCGQNGVGKTYACYALYAYIRRQIKDVTPLFDLNELLEKNSLEVSLDYDSLYSISEKYATLSPNYINNFFGLQRKQYFSDFRSYIVTTKDEFQEEIKAASIEVLSSFLNCSLKYKKEHNSDIVKITLEELNRTDDFETLLSFVDRIQNSLINKILGIQSLVNAYILPVERNSVYTFIDELAVNRFDINNIEELEKNKDRYPRPIQDALTTAVDLKRIKKNESKYKWLAEEIERTILHGNISISDEGELQFVSDKAPDKILPPHLSASIIKNLSGLLIYLKHQAEKNDLLIIDEPELGLHPDNQILLARILAKIANNGIRVLLNTHSDYIIRELNNLIMLSSSKINKEIFDEWGYNESDKLYPKDVGAYLFDFDENDMNHVKVKSLAIEENGFEIETIEKAINTLSDRSLALYYQIMKLDNE